MEEFAETFKFSLTNSFWYDNISKQNLICGSGGMADALDSGSSRGNSVQVQVLLPAPKSKGRH